jgi:pyruvate formate lyase activating enzyme
MAGAMEARYWEPEKNDAVRCRLCPHQCVIQASKRGICGVRENQGGSLVSLNYARAIAQHNDPIEKKPLFHVLPGSSSLSVATVGCNLSCAHCQNHDISQYPRRNGRIPGELTPPAQVIETARSARAATISFTYSEPTIFMEWAQDIAGLAAEQSIRCVSVTNGYTSAEPIRDLAPHLLAANVDLKSFREDFYRKVCGAKLEPVLATIRLMREVGIWVEVTTLLIPGLNDSPEELADLAGFLASVDPAIPWHLSRFHPDNEMFDRPPTPVGTIARAREIGNAKGLRFVYSGNVWGDEGEHTRCPSCDRMIIERHGFRVRANHLQDGKCPDCGEAIEGVWK